MNTYMYIELSSCVKGERFKYTFTGGDSDQNVALLTEAQFEKYKEKRENVKRQRMSSPAVLTSTTDDDKLVLVRDMDGKAYPEKTSGKVERYSPLIPEASLDGKPKLFHQRVKNASNTDADDSMIKYWDEHKSKYATVDLTKKTIVCPSCGKTVNVSELDGAHVVINGKGSKKYITPTCQTCNRSKVKRIFEVNTFDLVEAPE